MAELETPMDRVEIKNVGPIERLTIPIPEDGGVVVITGENGNGKTHAIDSIKALNDDKAAKKALRMSDGARSGEIIGMGVKVRLGRSNTRRTNQLVCKEIEGHVDPSQLVDPGIKDPKAADERRLKSLIRLAGIKIGADAWCAGIPVAREEMDIRELVGDDPVLTAEKIRRRVHEIASAKKRLAASKASEAASIAKEIESIDFNIPSQEELQKAFEDATSELEKAKSMQFERAAMYKDFANAKQSFDNLTSTLTPMEPIVGAIRVNDANIKRVREKADSLEKQIAELLELQKRNQADLVLLETAAEDFSAKLFAAESQRQSIDKFNEIIAKGEPELVSSQTIENLTIQKDNASSAMNNGAVVRDALNRKQRGEAIADEAQKLFDEEKRIREMARSTDVVLDQALIEAGFDKIKVSEGFLCVETDRGIEPFSELSHGERWRLALELAADGYAKQGLPSGSILPVRQEAWESLDPRNRREVNEIAKRVGLVIVTAEATDGELKAEVVK